MSPLQPVAARAFGLAAAFQVCPGGVVMVLGIIWHSFPWERVVRWYVPPQFSPVSPHTIFPPLPTSTPCLWPSSPYPQHSHRGEHAVGLREEEEAGVSLWRWLAQLYFITRQTRRREVPLSSLRQPGGVQGAPARACGAQAWPCTTLRPLKQACRAGSEEITLDATWCLKTAQPVPRV